MPTETHAPTRQKYANDLDTMALTNSNFHFSMRDWHGHLHLCSAAQKVFEKLCLRARLKYGAWTTIPGYDLIVEDTRLSERRVQDITAVFALSLISSASSLPQGGPPGRVALTEAAMRSTGRASARSA
jgi:hypothetical protein